MLQFFYFDFSLALRHAYYLKGIGLRATVGKDIGAEKYHVRVIQGA